MNRLAEKAVVHRGALMAKQGSRQQGWPNTATSRQQDTSPDRFARRPQNLVQGALQRQMNDTPRIHYLDHMQGMLERSPRNAVQRKSEGSNSGPVAGPHSNQAGLPDSLRTSLEDMSGFAMDDVSVHYGSSQPARLQAHAYTQGTDIHIGPGQEQYLPHEAWHVVQQKQGRVKPTLQLAGVDINDNAQLEREADLMGARAARNKAGQGAANTAQLSHQPLANKTVQGDFWESLGKPELWKNLGIGTAVAGGLSALAYGGYRYFRHRQRENTLADIAAEQAPQNIAGGAPTILPLTTAMDTPSLVQATNPMAPQAARNYQIDINPNNPVGLGRTDAALMRIAEIHERTHASADMAYSGNQAQSRLWLVHGDPAAVGFGAHNAEQYERIGERLIALEGIVENDNALTEDQREEMMARVNYAGQYIEYDPVINELLAYTQEYGIRANSSTVKALVALARENLTRRQAGGPDLQNAWPG